ncbi:hypothetical protein WJR50_26270 [Catalinimonas sp. 4WD22]|uniref:hypothetical protein n=1 Tax=Catalinimonas locisalis TaxID=3133978 RepID=UPI003101033F
MKNSTRYTLITICFFVQIFEPAFAQESSSQQQTAPNRHRIFLEFAGNGGFYSINYAYNITERFSARVGAELFPPAWTEESQTVAGFPILLNYQIYHIGNHHLLLGLGTLLNTNGINTITAMIAYELQIANTNMLRIGFTPHYIEGDLEPWMGLGVGFIF